MNPFVRQEEGLSEADLAAVVAIFNEVCIMEGDGAAKKRSLMNHLCRLIDADSWAWSLVHLHLSQPTGQVVYLYDGMSDEEFAWYLRAVSAPDMNLLLDPYVQEIQRQGRQITRCDSQFITEELWKASVIFTSLWEKANLGHLILTSYSLGESGNSGIGIYRRHGRPAFTQREVRIAHIILTEVPWLHTEGWPEDYGEQVPRLAAHLTVVLNLLMQGMRRGVIAEHLQLSAHTVDGYVKEVYRYFNVHSQLELITRFREGDGGDLSR